MLNDKQKLEMYMNSIKHCIYPNVESKEAKKILNGIQTLIGKIDTWFIEQIKKLPDDKKD